MRDNVTIKKKKIKLQRQWLYIIWGLCLCTITLFRVVWGGTHTGYWRLEVMLETDLWNSEECIWFRIHQRVQRCCFCHVSCPVALYTQCNVGGGVVGAASRLHLDIRQTATTPALRLRSRSLNVRATRLVNVQIIQYIMQCYSS